MNSKFQKMVTGSFLLSKCFTSSLIKYIVIIAGETSLTFSYPSKMIKKCFGCPIENKSQLSKRTTENDVDIKYCIINDTVSEIKCSAADKTH